MLPKLLAERCVDAAAAALETSFLRSSSSKAERLAVYDCESCFSCIDVASDAEPLPGEESTRLAVEALAPLLPGEG